MNIPIHDSLLSGIDNTNPDADGRKEWIELARKHDVPIRCVWFNIPKALCQHNDVVRALNKSVSLHLSNLLYYGSSASLLD
jgi:predicted kinase